jgi:TolB-like protein
VAAITIMLAGASRAWAAPTTAPSAPGDAKPQAQDVQDPRPRVLVMPFEELSDAPKRDWVGKAMQQSLVAELTRTGLVAVVTPPADNADVKNAKDAKAVAKVARDLQAALVITGTYQLLDQDLRVTGQMLESINGEPVAGIKATGNLRDLFGIQDQIGEQVRRDLQAIFNTQPAQPDQRNPRDPFNAKQQPQRQPQQPRNGTYTGSDLQRSLDDQWAPPDPGYDDTYARGNTYPPPYYPPYSYYDYYDWCGYGGPIYGVVRIPTTPFNQQNNNYVTTPGQLGRTNQRIGNNFVQGPPGQMGRTSGSSGNSSSIQSPPGQMGRTSSGSTGRTSTGSSGRTSAGTPGQMRGSR